MGMRNHEVDYGLVLVRADVVDRKDISYEKSKLFQDHQKLTQVQTCSALRKSLYENCLI